MFRRNFIMSTLASLFSFGATVEAKGNTGYILSGGNNDTGCGLNWRPPTVKITLTMPSGQVVILNEMPKEIVIDYPDHMPATDRKDEQRSVFRGFRLDGKPAEPVMACKQLHFGPLKIRSKAPVVLTGTQEAGAALLVLGECPDGVSNGISLIGPPNHGLSITGGAGNGINATE